MGLAIVSTVLTTYWIGKKAHQAELANLMYVYQEAMLFLRAGSVTEKVTADVTRRTAELQVKALEDALAKEAAIREYTSERRDPPARIVSGYDKNGKALQVDLSQGWELVE